MNEPKRRGRPPKAQPASAPVGQSSAVLQPGALPGVDPIAEAYAIRVWNGQSISAPLDWRIERVLAALEGQGLLATGISLPPIEVQDE